MEKLPSSDADTPALPAPAEGKIPSSSCPSSPGRDGDAEPEQRLSKKQLKKRRRWEKAKAVKRRRKEQEREVRRLKAEKEGRDLDAERRQQLQNESEGRGWQRREERWKDTMRNADIENSFRVCFDCSFDDQMTQKECNSLSLQLRYTYAVNRKSPMPVYIDVCGLKKGGKTREGLEKVEGFPERWVGRAFHCYEKGLEEFYGCRSGADSEFRPKRKVEQVSSVNGGTRIQSNDAAEDVAGDDNDSTWSNVTTKDVVSKNSKGATKTDSATHEAADKDSTDATVNGSPSGNVLQYPNLPSGHKFVYLTGDSPNTLTTLGNNTTYIIGGIVDRNRLKRAAIQRADSIGTNNPTINIETARLPLDENFDFKGSTRILTCNHVFEILQKYRENGYKDWRGSIAAVLPCRKDVEEKDRGAEKNGDAAIGSKEGAAT